MKKLLLVFVVLIGAMIATAATVNPPSLAALTALLDGTYLKLDCSNDPLTANLDGVSFHSAESLNDNTVGFFLGTDDSCGMWQDNNNQIVFTAGGLGRWSVQQATFGSLTPAGGELNYTGSAIVPAITSPGDQNTGLWMDSDIIYFIANGGGIGNWTGGLLTLSTDMTMTDDNPFVTLNDNEGTVQNAGISIFTAGLTKNWIIQSGYSTGTDGNLNFCYNGATSAERMMTLENDGDLVLAGDLVVNGGNITTVGSDLRLLPSAILALGSGSSYVHIYASGGQPMYFDSGDLFNFRDADAGNAVRATLNSATGDLALTGDLAVNGGVISSTTDFIFDSGGSIVIDVAGGGNNYIYNKVATTTVGAERWDDAGDQRVLLLNDAIGNQLVIANYVAGLTRDFDHDPTTDPTLFIHSDKDPNTDNTEWLSLSHNQTDAYIEWGSGSMQLKTPSGTSAFTIESAAGNTQLYLDNSLNTGIGLNTPSSKLHINGGLATKLTTITADNTPLTRDHSTVLIDTTAGNVDIDLPEDSTCPNRIYSLKWISAANTATVTVNGSDTGFSDGVGATYTFGSQWDVITIQNDGAGTWNIL